MHKEYWDSVTPEELQAIEEKAKEACEWFDAIMLSGGNMRKNLLICDGCGKEYSEGLLNMMLKLYQYRSDTADPPYVYDFCSYYCLGRWVGKFDYRNTVKHGISDAEVSSK